MTTGGSRSLGAAIAKRLASDGAAVTITYSASSDKAKKVVGVIEAAGGRAMVIPADAVDRPAVKAAVAKTVQALERLDIGGLTKALARDLGPRGIPINNVQPGPTETDMKPASGSFADEARQHIALQRYAQVEEVADFVAYLACPGASFITGASLAIDGDYAA